jgi:hypothetical protein
MTAAIPAAGQVNTDGSCYSCYRTEKTHMTAEAAILSAGQENTDDSCYFCCRKGEHK